MSLERHLLDVEQAACDLFRADTRWAASFARFFRLDASSRARFLPNLRVAALAHDLGKANADFQDAVTSRTFVTQSLRHEHLSALVLADPRVRAWLGGAPQLDVDVVLAAVLGHHLRAAESGPLEVLQSKSAAPTRLLFDDAEVRGALARIGALAGLAPFSGSFPARFDDDGWHETYDALFDSATRFRSALRADPARSALALAVKCGLVIADSVASGLTREGLGISEWIEAVAHAPALRQGEIEDDILAPRIAQLTHKGPFRYQGFQDGAAQVGRRALLLAACGAGKTLAAWRWAAATAVAEPVGRVIFLYPTRGTATEGFRDYVGAAPEGKSALVHGTARYELQGMQDNPQQLPPGLRDKDLVPDEAEERLFSLALWSKRFFSATVDQFLSFMENGYGGLCLVPALADAAVVFDEVHSYDRNLWNALVTFLQRFDVPVLCMTATLPPSRRSELERLLRVYPTERERDQLADLERAETALRYRLRESDVDGAFAAAVDAVRDGGRVLWVVNTVRRCQAVARRLKAELTCDVLVYHSRFKLEDRQARHRETVDAFRAPAAGEAAPAIAVTTQVCEMSLDLDADVVITEHAPISSLVQRFGRGNRHLRRQPSFRAELIAYAPESALPYDKDEIDAVRAFLRELAGRELSQRELAMALERHAPPGRDASGASRFVDGGYFATPGCLRDGDDSGAVAILDSDLERFKRSTADGDDTDGLRLNVPRRHARPDPALPRWLSVADGRRYDPWLGFVVGDNEAGAH